MPKNTANDQLNKLVEQVSSIRAGKTFTPTDYTEPINQALYQDLLELAEHYPETTYTGAGIVEAIPVEALKQYFGKET